MACSNLASINIPNSVTSIDLGAFANCNNLTSFTFPNLVVAISKYIFYGCTNLTSVFIPESVTSIGYGAFYSCSSLTSITIPESVTTIGDWAFGKCQNMTSVTLSKGLTDIGVCAFNDCSNLTSISIPKSVTSIGLSAFWGCRNLISVIIEWTTPVDLVRNENSSTFSNRSNATLYVPAGSKAAYMAAYEWQEFKEIVEYTSLEELLKTLDVAEQEMPETDEKTIFDLNGRRVSSDAILPKGIYIVNGRKVMMKYNNWQK